MYAETTQVSAEFHDQPLIAGRGLFGEADHRVFVSWTTNIARRPSADAWVPRFEPAYTPQIGRRGDRSSLSGSRARHPDTVSNSAAVEHLSHMTLMHAQPQCGAARFADPRRRVDQIQFVTTAFVITELHLVADSRHPLAVRYPCRTAPRVTFVGAPAIPPRMPNPPNAAASERH